MQKRKTILPALVLAFTQGRWRGNCHGLKFQPTNRVVFVNALANDAAAPHARPEQSWWDKFMGWF